MKFIILLCLLLVAVAFQGGKSQRNRNGIKDYKNQDVISEAINPNVVGGHEVVPNSVPYQIVLERPAGNFTWGLLCGGSIISPTKIVTAAHCLYSTSSPTNLRVVAGEHDLKVNDGHEQIMPVASFKIHPQYNVFIGDYDYGVIHLAKPLRFNKFVAPIQLPTADYIPSGFCTATGWGTTRGAGGEYPDKLQGVTMPLVTREECAAIYLAAESDYNVTENMICAGGTGGKSTCSGDSGGPLVCNGVLAGIVSWGEKPCDLENFPGVYANVAVALDWIAKN